MAAVVAVVERVAVVAVVARVAVVMLVAKVVLGERVAEGAEVAVVAVNRVDLGWQK